MKKPILIFGAGEIAQLAHYYFTGDARENVAAFCTDKEYKKSDTFCGLPLVDLETAVEMFPPAKCRAFVAISYAKMNQVRELKYKTLKKQGYEFASYVSSKCTNLAQEIGENCFILEDNTLQPFSRIGNNVTLWSGNHIGHHSTIQDNCFITSHVVVSGGVVVESNSFIGVNATLRDHIVIGSHTLVSAGALILHNTEPHSVYKSERAKKHAKRSDEIDL
jgi:sugar O-acyltransferase (sialic acid O-acetyltransferase NeuD family)